MNNVTIKVLSECDWQEYRSIRLKSLTDSPDSFGSTFEREANFTAEQWKSRLSSSSRQSHAQTLVATANHEFIGLISGVIRKSDVHLANIYQMWVDPEFRRKGIGFTLVDNIRSWATDKNVMKLQLSVAIINKDAVLLYKSIGFQPTGQLEPLRTDSELESQVMELIL